MALRSLNFEHENLNISYELINNNANSYILFLHGWGSNKQIMKNCFSNYLHAYNHIYVDLCGFGNSLPPFRPFSTFDYAKVLLIFIQRLGIKVHIVLGHSFGGKVALILAENIAATLILISSAGIKRHKSMSVKIKILCAKILKNLGLNNKFLRSKDALNINPIMYETFKIIVNEDLSKYFKSFPHFTLICWGKSDRATPLEDGLKIADLIPNNMYRIYDGDHWFFLNQADKIEEFISEFITAR